MNMMLFWANIVVCAVLLGISVVLFAIGKRNQRKGMATGGYICLSLGIIGILFHVGYLILGNIH